MTRSPRGSVRFVLALILLVGCVGCDQATKHLATEMLRGRPPQSYWCNTVRLQYALNPGGFLSLGANLAPTVRFWLFTVLNVTLLVGAMYMLLTRWNMRLVPFIAVVLILTGGLGNQIDRSLQGGLVTDFLNLGIGPLRTGIFNVADVALTVGALTLVLTYRDTDAKQK